MNIKTPLGRLRLLALLEGISFLLFAVTMPLKYVYGITAPNFVVGMIHGWLFIAYVALCFQNIYIYRWRFVPSFLALLASLLPAGTFVADAKIFKPQALKISTDPKGA